MDELKKLYDGLVEDGSYTKTFEEFQKQFQDASYRDRLYNGLVTDGLYTKSKDEFLRKYAVGPSKSIIEPVKKKETPAPISGSEFLSGIGSSESSDTEAYKFNPAAKPAAKPPVTPAEDFISSRAPKPTKDYVYTPTITLPEGYVPAPETPEVVARDNTRIVATDFGAPQALEKHEAFIAETNKLKEQAKKIERAKAQEEEQLIKSRNAAANQDAQFQEYLQGIDANLIDKVEEDVVPELNKKFNPYGFHFEEAVAGGDAMYVRTADGKHELLIPLDPFTTSQEVATSKQLRDFLTQYAQGREEVKSEDYINKALRAQNMRDVGMRNDDGTYSTVKFTSFEENGKYFVVPTLFPKDPNATYTTNKSDWIELPFEQAVAEARKRGEIFQFDSDQEAKGFAQGDWKGINAFDVEGQAFYKEKGLDYYAEKKKYENYTKLQDELDFLDNILGGGITPQQDKIDNPEYFAPDGRGLYTKEELEQKRAEVLKKKDSLLEQVYDIEVMGVGDGPVQKTREDFDVVLNKRQNEIAGEAIKMNAAATDEYKALDETSMALYNVPIEKIGTIIPKTAKDAENIKNLTAQLVKVNAAKKDAALRFETAKTYYDAKWNKAASSEYEENWAGFTTSVADAWNNGQAAEQIMLLTLGVKNAEDIKDRQEAARIIAENLLDVSGKQSRALTRLNLARDGEWSKTLLADPFEATATFVASSLTQMLPYASYIVPSATAAGAATGAVAGLMGGPFAEVTVPGGAIAGATQGLRLGMTAVSFGTEYTNSILDVMREKGYDLLDPKQVEAALSDESVWAEGSQLGISRGIPIAVVDYLSSGLAGRVFKTSKLASMPVKLGAMAAERAVFDPAAEALGEYAAQTVAGQDINFKEIAYEALGGLGNNTSHMAVNLYREARNNSNADLAYELTDINTVANERVSDEKISSWANNMHKLGKIDADVNQRIQENVGLRREARDLTSVGTTSRLIGDGKKVEARVMQLLSARNELSSTQNRKEINGDKIRAINKEIATISETKKLLPDNKDVAGDGVTTAVNLDAIIGTERQGVSLYKIGGKTFTREQFLSELDKMKNRRLLRARVDIKNDEEAIKIYNNKLNNAIQKQSPSAISIQSETGVSKTVEEGKPQTELEVTTEETQVTVPKEEVAKAEEDLVSSKTRLDELADAIPQRIDYTEDDLTNFDALEQQKADGVITALAEKVAEGTKLSTTEKQVYNANKEKVDGVSQLVAEKTSIEEEVADLEAMLKPRAEFRAEERVVPAKIENAITEDGEVDFEAEDQVRKIANERNIGITRDREIAYVARDEQGNVVGGAFTSYDNQTGKYTFDVVVTKEAEGKGIGSKLLDAVQNIPSDIAEMNPDATVEVDVVNPQMQRMLSKRGFEVSEKIGEERVLMVPGKKSKTEFRAEETTAEAPIDEVEAITDAINQIVSGNVSTELAPESTEGTVDVTDLSKRTGQAVPTVSFKIVEGVPVIFTISDQLTTGEIVNPQTGRAIGNLMGGIGFNFMNQNAAWAYTTEKKASESLKKAKKVYKENKQTIEEFWKNNPEYNGLVPMMVVKMGEGSILSNEATARVLSDNIQEFPEANRKRALAVLQKELTNEIKSLTKRADAAKSVLTKRNYQKEASGYQNILDLIAKNNIQTIEQLLAPEVFTQIENLNARKDIVNMIGYGKPNLPREKKAMSKPTKNSLVARAIIGIPANQEVKDINPNKRYELLNLGEVTNTITESTIADISNRSIVSIVGVDVLNPRILNTENGDFNHPNYQYGLAGKSIGILQEPISIVKAYPEAYNLALKGLIKEESKFVKPIKDGKKIVKPGNRLFNQSIPEASEIADRYYERTYGRKRPRYYGSRSIDKARAKRIADSFAKMADNPTAPDVKKAYEAMARETLEQYKYMLDAGYVVEINNNEPYGNSREMVDDLRNNKRMKIFSTESGFGDEKITPEQREKNVLLRESGFYDINGETLLVNDVFRAVHDFFGHSELGNSFGAIGEENAWNVHARMYSPLARQAMTTETRGQNSYVNFSGVNERVDAMRQEAAVLRDQGKIKEAEAIVNKIYEEISFAEQKQGILPKEFSDVDLNDTGDKEFQPASVESILTKAVGVQNGLTQGEFIAAVAEGDISNATKLANFLSLSFPSVTVSTDKVSFNNVMSQVGTEAYMVGDQIIYGVTVDGDIYINPDVHNTESSLFNTTIHEFGHVWTDYLQTSKKGKQLYERGVQLVEEGIANDAKVKEIFDAQMKKYPGDRARAINETMAILIGNKGEVITNAAIKSKFKEWLLGMWRYVKETFKMSKDLSVEEIQNLTLDQFIGTALADIFSGEEIKLSEAQQKQLKNPDAMFSSTQSMQSIIQQARANGFSDAAIKQVLLNRGFKASDINNALVIPIDVDTNLPREFADIDGGVQKGLQLFNDVRIELQRFAHMGPRGGIRKEVTKTMAQIREKAIELLKSHPIYQAQSDTVQMELISAFDRTLGTAANANVTRQITAIRNNLRQRKIGARELQQAKIAVKNMIRSVLPKSDTYSQAQINRLISIIANSTEDTILADTDKVMKIVEQQRAKMKTSVLKQMLELVNKKAKAAMTTTGKRRSKGLDPEGQAFFAQVKPILRAVINNDIEFMIKLADELAKADADGSINDALIKQNRGEQLTVQEQALLNKAYAFDTFGDLMSMELEDVQQLLDELVDARAESIKRLNTRREVRALKYAALNAEASAQVSELNPELFVEEIDANGNVTVRPKTRNELVQDRAAIRKAFQGGKIWSGFKQLVARWDYTTITGIKDFMRKRILHLGSLMNLFDNDAKGMAFFRDNIYRPLNRMDEKSKLGYFLEMQNLDSIANSIPGITKGYKQIRNMLQTGIHEFTINGKTDIYNADKLLRIYALSLNDVQREKLRKMGWDDAQIQKIKDIVGPEPIAFAEKLVDYFSNDYYESVNNVYSNVNDVNLGYVPNYFPTITQAQKVGSKLLEDGDFNGIFNAETAPALKERTDVLGEIELNYDFSDVVESHFVTMEKYKAYAAGVKELNAIFQNPAFNVLLEESGLKSVVKRSVNFAITPNAGQQEEQTALGKLMTKFTGFALAFKAIQIVKQATSFINAYEDYSYFPADSKLPGIVKGPVDLMMFMVDSAKVIATLPKQIRKAYGMSANVRDRMLKGIEGDVYGLESGSSVFSSIDKRTDIWARAVRAFKTGAAGPTVLGDILGVMGYMVNYNRNIANGMSPDAALEAFNNYNATAQSRRGTEKSSIQQNSSELARAFTMFGSTTFLQINKVLEAQTNIFRALKEGKMPNAKDIRAFAINLGLTNALFVGTANIAKFIKGDDDDREEALRQMKRALVGLNLIESIPLVGAAVETALAHIEGEKKRGGDAVVNPYMQVYNKIRKASEDGIGFKSLQPIAEIVIGAQLDPFIGLYNGVADGFDEEAVYDLLGISKSYRPTEEKDTKSSAPKDMTKEDMKRYFPEMYEQMYGPGSPLYDYEQEMRDMEKMEREQLQQEKDLIYGYDEDASKSDGTVWSKKKSTNKKESGTVWGK
jgi:ribosomal protein S18 acetylase RimI-like enzyme